jgi:excisionase family DNA binding protein
MPYMNKQSETSDAETLLTLPEAARILKVHPITLKRWAKAHKVNLVRLPVGNRPRIARSEIERLLTQPTEA